MYLQWVKGTIKEFWGFNIKFTSKYIYSGKKFARKFSKL